MSGLTKLLDARQEIVLSWTSTSWTFNVLLRFVMFWRTLHLGREGLPRVVDSFVALPATGGMIVVTQLRAENWSNEYV